MSFTQCTREADIRLYLGEFNSATIGVKGVLALPGPSGRVFIIASIMSFLNNSSVAAWATSPVFTLGTNAPNYDNVLGNNPQLGLVPGRYRPSIPLAAGAPAVNQPIMVPAGATISANVTTAGVLGGGSGDPEVLVYVIGAWVDAP